MKARKCSSVIHVAFRILTLTGLLALAPLTDLRAEPKTADRPYAYIFSETLEKLTEHLQRQGIEVNELREDIELDVEAYKIRIRGRVGVAGRQDAFRQARFWSKPLRSPRTK